MQKLHSPSWLPARAADWPSGHFLSSSPSAELQFWLFSVQLLMLWRTCCRSRLIFHYFPPFLNWWRLANSYWGGQTGREHRWRGLRGLTRNDALGSLVFFLDTQARVWTNLLPKNPVFRVCYFYVGVHLLRRGKKKSLTVLYRQSVIGKCAFVCAFTSLLLLNNYSFAHRTVDDKRGTYSLCFSAVLVWENEE